MQKRILFIGGSGRSGSTILDRCLGAESGCVSVGEIAYIWETSFIANRYCGKYRFHEHPFWNAVFEEAKLTDMTLEQANELYQTRVNFLRLRQFFLHGFRIWPSAIQPKILHYIDVMNRLYAAIFSVSGANVIVDSSKIATHGAFLSLLSDFHTSFVHLTRDSRAVAFSWSRIKNREPGNSNESMPLIPTVRSARYWMVHNGMMHLLTRQAPQDSQLVRYEDFARTPKDTASLIFSKGGVSASLSHINGDEAHLPESHNINGNPSKFQHGVVKLKSDDVWRDAMPVRARMTATLLTFPLLLTYGYKL